MMPNPVVRWQIISPKPGATASFYQKLFDWSLSKDNALGYRELKAGENGMDGGVWPGPPEERPFAQIFIEVPSVDEYIERATALGAAVLVPASVLPDGDVMAVLKDPVGLPFAICSKAVN
ncbi:MAG TPA: VOC family protein [Gemmatimonadaceae bacterium]|nr:VOC family protein [Gemmatimonadaceae bacterium]